MHLRHLAILACGLAACVSSDELDGELDTLRNEVTAVEEGEELVVEDDLLALAEDDDDDADVDLNAEDGAPLDAGSADEEVGEALEFAFQGCVHGLDEKRPRLTKEVQRRTKRIIDHVAKRTRMSPSFKKLLTLVALRESSYQQGLVHRLQPDLEGSQAAWRKMSKRYEGNDFADDSTLWQTYGLFGMNSNYFTMLWDRAADPRVLCDPIVDVLVYRRAAERALRKLNGTIRCRDANGEAFDYQTEPTWAAVHRAVSGGKVCPAKHENQAAIMRKYFNARASRKGLDPNERVTGKMLGAEPDESVDGEPWETQEEMVMGLWEEFEALEDEEES
ncbi:MAG: hypothetical protein R3A51_05040 [Nannocystaceae bacterium]|nr:hypothetical protein [Myxococcales bacterium]